MLLELSIKDFAIIDSLSVSFSGGFSVFTGETGAGKSIIIDAIDLVLGDRARSETIRGGAEESVIEALFDITKSPRVLEKLKEAGLEASGGELLIKRVVNRAGRNKVYINNGLSTLVMLAEVTGALIDICGQSEHQSLARNSEHIEILDLFAGLASLRAEMSSAYQEMRALEAELAEVVKLVEAASQERELKEFQLDEITSAALQSGEEAKLALLQGKLKNAEKLSSSTVGAESVLYSEEGSIIERLGMVIRELSEVSSFDGRIAESVSSLNEALYALEDSANFLRDYSTEVPDDEGSLEEVEDRLDLIQTLKRKYALDVDGIVARAGVLEAELGDIEGYGVRRGEVEAKLASARTEAEEIAGKLTKKRLGASLKLKGAIEEELKDLAMDGATFEVDIKTAETPVAETDEDLRPKLRINEKGADRVSFLISTNPGEELLPIERIASGGELSRIMLAMKKSTSFGKVGTLIFDEIDTGVGGPMAKRIAVKLKDVSLTSQVLCITHMPQIAAYADHHYYVSKGEGADQRVVTSVEELTGESVTNEITRMLGGESGEGKASIEGGKVSEGSGGSATAQSHAKELLAQALKAQRQVR
ncbi:MAG: DNA repair protein RecN [Thermodesulfobacteriota bacterium]